MDLYLYSTFLVLIKALYSTVLHSPSHTHIHHSASFSRTLLFYEAQFGVQHLAQGHFGMQIILRIELPTFRLEDDHSTPSATAKICILYFCNDMTKWHKVEQKSPKRWSKWNTKSDLSTAIWCIIVYICFSSVRHDSTCAAALFHH